MLERGSSSRWTRSIRFRGGNRAPRRLPTLRPSGPPGDQCRLTIMRVTGDRPGKPQPRNQADTARQPAVGHGCGASHPVLGLARPAKAGTERHTRRMGRSPPCRKPWFPPPGERSVRQRGRFRVGRRWRFVCLLASGAWGRVPCQVGAGFAVAQGWLANSSWVIEAPSHCWYCCLVHRRRCTRR